ncbi:cAMP-binding domain of CRP or a regulatory subunit of cAMP-dependent protein kinases [Anaerobium acetethylicum]|uniref:cAMP-binding domain of CRP or a regulatory subunit of cAMP-dependent protein kinases n=2 Tax=Anaerobium acetethylicum TaxID=1619234 RepID=A0A1D3TPE5_9FIRM|nr:cAMP-binding domain of CRP or a regulatory subunit of cAMP-dependent protein kinases [Anaerobium acetethylicum]
MKEYIDLLMETPLFGNIKKEELDSMLTCLKPYVKSFKKGNYITHSGDDIKSVGVVLQGTVQMVKEDIWGNKTILAIMTEKSVFGETFVCSRSYNSTVSFQAAADCTVMFLSFERILHSCHRACSFHNTLIDNVVILIAQKNIQLMEKLEVTSKKSLREKILTYLSREAQRNGSMYFEVPLGRIELSDYLCADRSALTRELSRMKAEGLIDYDRNTFRLYEKID